VSQVTLYGLSHVLSSKNRKLLYSDLSLWALILSNLITIIWALIEGWSVGIIIWSYWSHSVSIGILWFFKILCLKDFSTESFTINDKPVDPTVQTKIRVAIIFVMHYGFFHMLYSFGLGTIFPSIEPATILPIAMVFFLYQCFSFFYNRKWLDKQRPNIGSMMFFPYIRIIPMHLSFIAGGAVIYFIGGTFSSNVVLVIFMLLKTLADVFMHTIERKGFGDKGIIAKWMRSQCRQ